MVMHCGFPVCLNIAYWSMVNGTSCTPSWIHGIALLGLQDKSFHRFYEPSSHNMQCSNGQEIHKRHIESIECHNWQRIIIIFWVSSRLCGCLNSINRFRGIQTLSSIYLDNSQEIQKMSRLTGQLSSNYLRGNLSCWYNSNQRNHEISTTDHPVHSKPFGVFNLVQLLLCKYARRYGKPFNLFHCLQWYQLVVAMKTCPPTKGQP